MTTANASAAGATGPTASTRAAASRYNELAADLERAGYYPQAVVSVVATALAGEDVVSYLVQPETSFADGVHRHLTVLTLTPTRLIVVHIDDAAGEDGSPMAMATSEAVALSHIQAVGIAHGLAFPAAGGALTELTISVSWGAMRRIEVEPVVCPDPACEADHGVTGFSAPDDVTVRVSAGVEGAHALEQARDFAAALSQMTSGGRRG